MILLSLLETAPAISGGGGGINTVELLLGLLNVLLGALTGAFALLRKRYESEITKLEARVRAHEEREAKEREAQDRLLAATELAMAVANKQNETISIVVDKQGKALDAIMAQLDDAKTTATRRSGARP